MTSIAFSEADHTYRVDGVVVPSVSAILHAAGLSVDYGAVPPAVLAYARDRGIYIDQCCELYDQGVLDWDGVVEEARPYVEAWDAFVVATGFKVLATQPCLYHPRQRYCGTPDVVGTIGGILAVVDRKATAKMAESYGVQLAAYSMTGIEGLPGLIGATGRIVVHLKKDGTYSRVTFEDPDDYEVFVDAIGIYRWKAKRNGVR